MNNGGQEEERLTGLVVVTPILNTMTKEPTGALRLSSIHMRRSCPALLRATEGELLDLDLALLDGHPVFKRLEFCRQCIRDGMKPDRLPKSATVFPHSR